VLLIAATSTGENVQEKVPRRKEIIAVKGLQVH